MGERLRKSESTICWKCENACGGCSWAENFIPVDGWDAEETIINSLDKKVTSYRVKRCPEFIPRQTERNPKSLDTEACLTMIEELMKACREDYEKGTQETCREIERFLRGHGAAKVHMIQDPETVIAGLKMLKKAYAQKRLALMKA